MLENVFHKIITSCQTISSRGKKSRFLKKKCNGKIGYMLPFREETERVQAVGIILQIRYSDLWPLFIDLFL